MRTIVAILIAVITSLMIGAQDTATAGVAWFQTTNDEIGRRTGAGVLTLPGVAAGQIGEVVMWTPQRVLVSSAGTVTELKFRGRSVEDTLGVAVFFAPTGEDGDPTAGLVIWTAKRVLLASAAAVVELTFQGESITTTLGVLSLVLGVSGTETALVIWTPKRVLVVAAEGVSELTFRGQSIRDTLGAVFVPLDGGGLVVWTRDRVLLSSGGPATELTFQGESIEHTLGVLLTPRVLDEEVGVNFVIWTTDRVLTVSGGVVSQLTFDGHAIRSKVKIADRPFRRQAESLATSLYEAEAVLRGAEGKLIMSSPVLEILLPPL